MTRKPERDHKPSFGAVAAAAVVVVAAEAVVVVAVSGLHAEQLPVQITSSAPPWTACCAPYC